MKTFFKIILFAVVVIFIIFVIIFLYKQSKLIMSGQSISIFGSGMTAVSPVSSRSGISNSVTEKISFSDPDLNGLDGTLEKIRQASLDNNIFLLNKYYSVKTLAYYSSYGGGRIIRTHLKDVIFSNIRKISSVKVLVTISQVEMSGHTEKQDVIFVRELDGWKMGVVETKN